MSVHNLSRVACVSLPTMGLDDDERMLVLAAGSFSLPRAEAPTPALLADQPAPPLADAYNGEPSSSSLRREGQSTFARPGTDIYLRGHAWAPGGRAATRSALAIRVGECSVHAQVFGDRVWVRTLGEVRPSPPARFTRMPILWERSFGGRPPRLRERSVAIAERNPVGRGLFDRGSEAADQPLPNFEDPRDPITQLADRPLPVGFGPIARHWQPRRSLAGTYDQTWLDERAPLWPADLDPRFFCAAAPGLSTTTPLEGGELVELLGLHPDGVVRFELPRLALQAKFAYHRSAGPPERKRLVLDGIEIDGDAWTLTLFWRAWSRPPRGRDASELELITLRTLAAWEVA